MMTNPLGTTPEENYEEGDACDVGGAMDAFDQLIEAAINAQMTRIDFRNSVKRTYKGKDKIIEGLIAKYNNTLLERESDKNLVNALTAVKQKLDKESLFDEK